MWLFSAPFTAGYENQAIVWNDLITGAFVVLCALLALSPRYWWTPWPLALAGVWLLFAPLVLKASSAAAYSIDTIAGALLFTLSMVVPGVPRHRVQPGPVVPPGWSYNPSAWTQRAPIIAIAFIGFLISRYMAAFQLGHIDGVWDPVFGAGTALVLESKVSKAFPISDAGLGAISYLLEALSGLLGGVERWRSMPWLVILFEVLVVPLGLVSIVLIMLQPVSVGAWCLWCLVTALLMLLMISPALDEVIATCLLLSPVRREGGAWWHALWFGGTIRRGHHEPRRIEALLSNAETVRRSS